MTRLENTLREAKDALQVRLEYERQQENSKINKVLIIEACETSTRELGKLDEKFETMKHFKKNSFNSLKDLEDIIQYHRIPFAFCTREWNINNKFWSRQERFEILTRIHEFESLLLSLTQRIRVLTLCNSEYNVKFL